MAQPTAPANQPAIEADPDLISESDSTLGDDVSRYTASLTSSIQAYPIENGRRYHAFKDGSYVMPNDDKELERLDVTHQMLKICLSDKLYLAPIADKMKGRVLDLGTGTGIWAIEFADEHPDAEILGTDISPNQPSWVPPNVKFEIDDCEAPWTWPEPFSYIHTRYMAAAIVDWPKLVSQVFAALEPGGWAEFQDFDLRYYSEDGSFKDELSISKWASTLLQASRDFGRDPSPGIRLEELMKECGFDGVVAQRFRLPIGPWPKDKHLKTVGSWNLVQIEEGLEAFTLRLFTQMLKWDTKEVQVLLADVRKNLRDPKIHTQFDFGEVDEIDSYVVYGQKPKTAGTGKQE